MQPGAGTRTIVLLGDPVRHSLSPAMHNAAIGALGLDAVYLAWRADATALAHVVRAFEAIGVAGNVTVPHKVAVAQLLIRLTQIAKDLAAVNTFWSEGGRLVGDNTDVAGILEAVDRLQAPDPWLLLGTGGAARAVTGAARSRATSLLVRSRDPSRGRDFVAWARRLGADVTVDDGRPVGTVINATPLGLKPEDALPLPDERLESRPVLLDLVYARGETRWIQGARQRGLRCADGRVVLVAQGAHAFERFFPGVDAPRDVMAAAVERELAR
jgi:shikimate dehydrogenase